MSAGTVILDLENIAFGALFSSLREASQNLTFPTCIRSKVALKPRKSRNGPLRSE